MKKTALILILGVAGTATSFAVLAIERQQTVEFQLSAEVKSAGLRVWADDAQRGILQPSRYDALGYPVFEGLKVHMTGVDTALTVQLAQPVSSMSDAITFERVDGGPDDWFHMLVHANEDEKLLVQLTPRVIVGANQLNIQQHTVVFEISRPWNWSIYGPATPSVYNGTLALLFEPTALAL